MRQLSLIVMTALSLTACGSLLPKGDPAPRLYTLNAPPSAPGTTKKLPFDMQILMPQAAPGLDTERVILRTTDNRIDYYADAKWAGTAPALVQSVLVESFEKNNTLHAVGSDLVSMSQHYNLQIEIRDFQSEYIVNTTMPRAHVRLVAKLIKADTNKVIATTSYDETNVAGSNTLQNIVIAFDRALQQATNRIITDTTNILGQQPLPVTDPIELKKLK